MKHLIILNPKAFAAFLKACANPPAPTQALRDLLKRRPVWSRPTLEED